MGNDVVTPTVDRSATSAADTKGPQPSEIRLRAFVAGLLIIPLDTYWVLMTEKVKPGPYPTTVSLFANVVFVLAVLAAVNSVLKKISRRLAFSSAEMLLIYAMVAIAAALAGHDMVPNLVGVMGHAWRFATPENDWVHTFIPYLPKSLNVSDPGALKALYEGNSSLYVDGHWLVWLMPAVQWIGFIVVLVFVMMCVNTLVRKQWIERERLTFPIVQLPLSMTEPKGDIWRNKLFWLGFGVAFGIDLLNGLALYAPDLPSIDVTARSHSLYGMVFPKPWESLSWLAFSFYPFVIGLGYLLPVDLSFSVWFFYLFWIAESVVTSAFGLDAISGFPFAHQQQIGGYMAVTAALIWSSRAYWKQVWLKLKNESSELDDSDEPMSYRAAVAGALVGVGFLAVFMMRIGLSPLLAVVAFVIYFIMAIAITRMRAELGPPVHDIYYSGPDHIIASGAGLGRLSNRDLVGLSYFFWFNRAQRSHPMPIGIESMKMAHSTRSSQKKFLWAIMAAALVGTIAIFWIYLHLGYHYGWHSKCFLGGAFAQPSFRQLDNWWKRAPEAMGPNWGGNAAMLGGFGFTMFLSYMRFRVLSWPFHPIGFAISGSYSMSRVWFPVMIAWFCKSLTLRFGGLKLYRSALPCFLGLILGEMCMGSIWSLIGIVFNVPYYSFWEAWI